MEFISSEGARLNIFPDERFIAELMMKDRELGTTLSEIVDRSGSYIQSISSNFYQAVMDKAAEDEMTITEDEMRSKERFKEFTESD